MGMPPIYKYYENHLFVLIKAQKSFGWRFAPIILAISYFKNG